MSSVNVVLRSTVIRHRSASGLSDDGPSESSKFSRDTPPALPSVTFASSVSSPARSDRGGKALRSLDLYDESARHYAWKKQALVDQKHDWRIWLQLILEEPDTSRAATAVAWITATAIVAQVLLIMFESGAFSLMGEEKRYEVADYTLVAFFSVEFVLRTVGATRLAQLCMSFFWWIDLLGVAPFYLELILSASVDTDNVKALSDVRDLLRLLRIVRVLKVMRHHPDSKILARALQMSARPLLVPFTFLVIGAIFFGSFVFFFERLEMRDELELAGEEGQFPDIGTAVWFMLVTFSTVGYGDVSPDSHSGKAVTSLAIIAGLIFMSMPLTIVGTNFSRVWEDKEKMTAVVKIQEHLIDRNLSVADVRKIFEEADLDYTGVINLREFSLFIGQMGLQPALSPSNMRSLFAVFDENRTGFISFFEFCHVVFPDLDVEELVEEGAIAEATPRHCPAGEQPAPPPRPPPHSSAPAGRADAPRPRPREAAPSEQPAGPGNGGDAGQLGRGGELAKAGATPSKGGAPAKPAAALAGSDVGGPSAAYPTGDDSFHGSIRDLCSTSEERHSASGATPGSTPGGARRQPTLRVEDPRRELARMRTQHSSVGGRHTLELTADDLAAERSWRQLLQEERHTLTRAVQERLEAAVWASEARLDARLDKIEAALAALAGPPAAPPHVGPTKWGTVLHRMRRGSALPTVGVSAASPEAERGGAAQRHSCPANAAAVSTGQQKSLHAEDAQKSEKRV